MGKFSVWFGGFLLISCVLLRLVAVRTYVIPDDDELSSSVAPSLSSGDLVLLWRFPDAAVGDLVVCRDPQDKSYDVIGRLIGKGRDNLEFRGANVSINGARMDTEGACKESIVTLYHPTDGSEVEARCGMEVIGGRTHKRAQAMGDDMYFQDSEPEIVEVSHSTHFLLSDNRVFPYDSRTYGEIDWGDCPEMIFFRLWGVKGFTDAETRFTFIK